MNKHAFLLGFLLFSVFSGAETLNNSTHVQEKDNNIFAMKEDILSFETEEQMMSYLKLNKPGTFRYFDRLSYQDKKQVFQKHQADNNQDITDIVLLVYRKNR